MEEKFIAAWESNRAAANLMGIRMRPLDLKGAKRILSSSRLSDGFNELKAMGQLTPPARYKCIEEQNQLKSLEIRLR